MWGIEPRMRRFLCLLTVLLLAAACCGCGNRHREKKPEKLLSEEQMIDVMADVYLVEAMLTQKKQQGQPIDTLVEAYYGQVFEHHGITRRDLEENMAYYTRQPAVLEAVMDSVAQRLEQAGRDR